VHYNNFANPISAMGHKRQMRSRPALGLFPLYPQKQTSPARSGPRGDPIRFDDQKTKPPTPRRHIAQSKIFVFRQPKPPRTKELMSRAIDVMAFD
jgi:hypothetical protein